MIATASAEPLPLFEALLDFFRRCIERTTASAPLSLKPLPDFVRRVGDEVLAAEDLNDLRDRAGEAALQLPLVYGAHEDEQLAAHLDELRTIDLAVAGFDRVLGEGPCATATTAIRMLAEVVKIWRSSGLLHEVVEHGPLPPNLLEELVYNASVPSDERRVILRSAMALPGFYAMGRALELGAPLPKWIARGVADLVAEGVQALASIVSLKPAALPRLRDEFVTQWVHEARARGLTVYFPLGDPDAATG